jgi:DNA-binding NtrC family response regulator
MLMNIIMVHDDPKFIEEAARALGSAGHNVVTFGDPMEALTALENDRFEILITRVRFPPGRPNGVALAQMALLKQPAIKVVFTLAPENVEYAEDLGKFVVAPISMLELVETVARLDDQREAEHPHC